MADEHDESTTPDQPAEEQPGHGENDKHAVKHELRDGVAKAWGLAVEVGSMLAGQGGEIVQAERAVAEDDAEDLIDRIDGEG